ncbi:MAG: ribosome biogenesis GTPase Der, partial [Bryobacteraceae bacterium]|nr:ribosome biogenesis GTPase Der [Bryobacteraceae bacterium]
PGLIPSEIFRQARFALERADHIVFLVDGRSELTSADLELARLLRRLARPIALAVNKIDSPVREALAHEFHSLGIPHLFPVSAEHRLGLDELLDHVTSGFPVTEQDAGEQSPAAIRVAIIGRPNVGKSTLLNRLVGQDRAIVSEIAGTTRDAVDETVTVDGRQYTFVDTAGIRRKGKTKLMAEKLSVVMARKHIRQCDVALVVLDAVEGVVGLDATIGGYAHEDGRAIILCVNKWDLAPNKDKKAFVEKVRTAMKFLEYAPVAFVSALSGAGTGQLFPLIRRVYEAASQRIPTAELNRFIGGLHFEPEIKIYYVTQPSVRPPAFVLFTDRTGKLHFSAERYLINRLRERFGFTGTPIVIKTRQKRG